MTTQKIAVVTGANKGIGFAIVRGLCKKFSGIVYLTARNIERGENAVKKLNEEDLYPEFHQLDVSDQASVDTFRDFIKSKHGGLDILVNNAAIAFPISIVVEQAKPTIEVNYFDLLRVCNALFPLLRSNARVVNISSSAGHLFRIPAITIRKKLEKQDLTEPELSALMRQFVESAKNGTHIEDGWGNSSYVVSKIGVSALSFIQQRYFDNDADRPGIAVNAVHPGQVATNMNRKGYLSIDQGADAPLYLALLPETENRIKGCYVWYNRSIVDWRANIDHLQEKK